MNKKNLALFLVIFNFLGYAGTIVVNALANALPINNKTTGELSDAYPNLFVPAGLTFSIWGLIYLLLTFYIIYQVVFLFKNKAANNSFITKMGLLFFISSLANMGWIFAWHYQLLPLSVLIMVVILITLISIYSQLNIGKDNKDRKESKLVHITFSVYLGWISIATIANFTAYLVNIEWDRFGMSEEFWTVIMLIIGIAITLYMLIQRKDIYYSLVVVWAFAGILIKRISVEGFEYYGIVITALLGIFIITVVAMIQLFRKKIY
jgi:hypothetical protein